VSAKLAALFSGSINSPMIEFTNADPAPLCTPKKPAAIIKNTKEALPPANEKTAKYISVIDAEIISRYFLLNFKTNGPMRKDTISAMIPGNVMIVETVLADTDGYEFMMYAIEGGVTPPAKYIVDPSIHNASSAFFCVGISYPILLHILNLTIT